MKLLAIYGCCVAVVFCGSASRAQDVSTVASAVVSVAEVPDWKRPLADILERAPQARERAQQELASHCEWKPGELSKAVDGEATLADLQRRAAQKLSVAPGDWLYERFFWRLNYRALSVARPLLQSPLAAERRQGLEITAWMLRSPFLRAYAPDLCASIADGFVVPFVGAASDDPTRPTSRLQLLRTVAEVYQSSGRHLDHQNALRAVVAVADPLNKNLADGARYQLAFELEEQGRSAQAVELLESITHDALRDGATQQAQLIRAANGL